MLRNTFFAVLTALAAAASSQAAIMLQHSAPTPLTHGGLVSYTVSAVGTAGELINTFSNPIITAASVTDLGIHQVWQGAAPPGSSTPTEEEQSGIWDPSWAAYDSYFMFRNSDYALNLGTQFTETNNALTSATVGALLPKFAAVFGPSATGYGTYGSDAGSTKGLLTANAGSNVPFFQVVMRAEDAALMNIRLDGQDAAGNPVVETIQGFRIEGGVDPVEFEVNDLTIGPRQAGALVVGGPLATNDSDDPDSLTWLLESLTGPGGAISLVGAGAPTISTTTGVFSWQSLASNPLGAYSAVIRGTNSNDPIGTDAGTLSFNLVPEPASITLLGLAMVGAIGFIRRR